MTLLHVQNLSIDYLGEDKDVNAVKKVSFSIAEGEIFALVGESGSGKSTIAQTILRILPPPGVVVGGDILYRQSSLLSLCFDEGKSLRWSKISMVFQSALSALNPTLSVAGHFKDTLRQHGFEDAVSIRERMNHWLQMTDLPESCAGLFPHQLSGGMKQRVVIALALALEPDLVIFDEATTALDVVVEQDVMTRILDLQRKLRFSALFITHDLGLMCRIADRVGVMKEGQLLEILPSSQFVQDAKHPYTRKLIDSLPKMPCSKPTSGGTSVEKPVLLKVVDLSKRFQTRGWFRSAGPLVVDGVNFDIRQGGVLALVGESGSGKSTIGRMICSLYSPTSGQIEWSIPSPRVQMIFQDPYGALNPVHTIGHHLKRPLLLSGSDKTVDSLLSLVDLKPSDAFKYPHELSGGQRQRVCIARALAGEPDLIVADEPTAMLDVSIRKDVLSVLENLKAKMGIAFLFITHDLTAAATFADQILVLRSGRVVEKGEAADVVLSPAHSYTQALLQAAEHSSLTHLKHPPGEDS